MQMQQRKDIFISYRKDGSGDQFGHHLCEDLEELGYGVYFDSNESYTHSFPDHIRDAIATCKDFILVISAGCLERLIQNEPIDWVREEILTARKYEKNIISILMDNVTMPKDASVMPESLRFLPHLPAVKFPEKYVTSPLSILISKLNAKQDGMELYKDVFNSNPQYSIRDDFSTILDAAKSGNIEAMYELGMMGFYGMTNSDGTQACWDYEQAAYWLKKVSESDHELRFHAQSTLARMYYHGTVPREPQSYEKAFQYHSLAAPKDPYSAGDVGFLLRNSVGCQFDFEAILEHYRNNVHQSDDVQATAIATFLAKYGRYQEAFDILDSMETLTPEASYQLGLLYRDGVLSDPPRPDYRLAGTYFKEAADENHINAAFEYGLLCFRPSGRFRKNFPKAEKYFRIAADGGHATAQYCLGYMCRCGHVKRDLRLAIEYMEKAKEQGHSLSALELASIYQQPECQNYQRAFECAQFAAAHSVAEGELILGNLLFWGRGCEADMNKAYELYSRAYEHGMYYASVMMKKIDQIKQNVALETE